MKKACKSRTVEAMCRISLTLLLLMGFFLGSPARADGSAAPGRAVGHVFLGMDRADVWKILGRPSHTATVPHGMSLYGEDVWYGNGHELKVISERDKAIQVEFDSPRITTTDGFSTKSTLAQIRRRYPVLTVRAYTFLHFSEGDDRYNPGLYAYYLDNMREGIAFVFTNQEGVTLDALNEAVSTIIIHRPGFRAVPLYQDRWPGPMAAKEDPNGLRLMRSWFSPRQADAQTPLNSLPAASFEQAPPHRILPGQGVDGVLLGTSRADVWKQIRKPSVTEVVPHGTHSYTVDLWVHDGMTVTIIFEQDRVVQIGFDNINYMTDDGRLVLLSLAKVCRAHPAMTVSCYDLNLGGGVTHQYYMDDVHQGIAFLYSTGRDITPWELESCVDTILVHRPGMPALPIYNKHWSTLEPPTEDPDGLRLMRSWFTPRKGN